MAGWGSADSTNKSAWTSTVGSGEHVIPLSHKTLLLIRY